MIYLLIDTDCLKRLVSTIEESYYLQLLQYWEKKGLIKLFCPEALKKEWKKHRHKEIERIDREIIAHQKKLRLYNISESLKNEAKKKLLNQINIIDSLLEGAIFIKESMEVKAKLVDFKREEKAPFHNKPESFNDASIIFSTLQYCIDNNHKKVTFVSHNTNEFGSPINLKRKLHPDIANDYPNVEIEYFSELNEAFKFFKEDLSLPNTPHNLSSVVNDEYVNYYDITKPFLEVLYQSLYNFFNEISFLHPKLFLRKIPTLEKLDHDVYHGFTLVTHNHHLYDFLSSIKIEADEYVVIDKKWIKDVDNYKDKIGFIIKALNENLIWYIEHNKETEILDLTILIRNKSSHDLIENLEFDGALTELEECELPSFKKGWLFYKLGFFVEATNYFEQAASTFENEDKKTLAFICYFNLNYLSILLENYYWGNNNHSKLIEKLKRINLEDENLKLPHNEEIFKWINEKKFYEQAFEDITQSFHNLRNQYYNSLWGGWSTGNEINNLISSYGLLDNFVNGNNIVFDFFSEFKELTDLFIETLILSHSIKGKSDRLEEFDEWLIYKILIYGNGDKLISYCKRYKVKKLLLSEQLKRDYFSSKLSNLIKTKKAFEYKNPYFHDYYNKLFVNLIVLTRLCNIDEKEIKQIATQLSDFCKTNNFINWSNFKYTISYFKTSAKVIPVNNFKSLLFTIIKNQKLHREENFIETCEVLFKSKKKLKFNTLEFDIIMDFCFKECQKCNEYHSVEPIVYIFKCLNNPSQKQFVIEKIYEVLNKNFDRNLYYKAILLDVIVTNDIMFGKFVQACIESNHIRMFNSKNRYHFIDALINLVFKLNRPLPQEAKTTIEKLDLYYEWLLNLNSFDYNKFDVYWLTDYTTKYYFEKFRKNQLIRRHLIKYLNNNHDERIERIFFNL